MIDLNASAWAEQGLCAQVDPELMFPEQGHADLPAKRVCRDCPVKTECLTAALEYEADGGNVFGVWGGTNAQDRMRMRRDARRAS